jgi:hypothetical protein
MRNVIIYGPIESELRPYPYCWKSLPPSLTLCFSLRKSQVGSDQKGAKLHGVHVKFPADLEQIWLAFSRIRQSLLTALLRAPAQLHADFILLLADLEASADKPWIGAAVSINSVSEDDYDVLYIRRTGYDFDRLHKLQWKNVAHTMPPGKPFNGTDKGISDGYR